MKKSNIAALALVVSSTLALGLAHAKDSIQIASPKSGATVSSPFKVMFAAEGVTVAPAGAIEPKSGHHHLVINGESLAEGQVIPFDEKHLHFGKAQTEAEVTLPPGKYTLTAQFGNGGHQSYGKALSHTIKLTVK